MRFRVEVEREVNVRWIAEVPEVPGALAYGVTMREAEIAALAIAASVGADSDL